MWTKPAKNSIGGELIYKKVSWYFLTQLQTKDFTFRNTIHVSLFQVLFSSQGTQQASQLPDAVEQVDSDSDGTAAFVKKAASLSQSQKRITRSASQSQKWKVISNKEF